jgi:hypothetical protein
LLLFRCQKIAELDSFNISEGLGACFHSNVRNEKGEKHFFAFYVKRQKRSLFSLGKRKEIQNFSAKIGQIIFVKKEKNTSPRIHLAASP